MTNDPSSAPRSAGAPVRDPHNQQLTEADLARIEAAAGFVEPSVAADVLRDLVARVRVLEEALRFYADGSYRFFLEDGGHIAREALSGGEG